MVNTASQMMPLGTLAPTFSLPDAGGQLHSLGDVPNAKGYLVVFMCNHCPFVKYIREELARLGEDCHTWGLAMVGINANDFAKYPGDAPERMQEDVKNFGYRFPYLVDASQAVAKVYRAACTPDFFAFDRDQKLAYRGQLDDSRPGNGIAVTGRHLRAALEAIRDGHSPATEQRPSIGCNIKWKPGNEPDYFG